MSDNPYLSLIANLNSESPVMSSPEDYSAELSLWTNAEFTFDMPPGLGIFEEDSGFDSLSSMNHPSHQGLGVTTDTETVDTVTITAPPPSPVKEAKVLNSQSALDQQHLIEYLNLPQEESRPLSLLERTRQRNPVNPVKPQSLPELQEQAAAINAFHSLLAAYSASAQVQQQQQQLQQPQPVQQQQQPQRSSGLPLLLPNIAPATAPTTPAAAKLLRQPMPQYKAANSSSSKKQKAHHTPAAIAPATTLVALAPKSPITANASVIAAAATAASNAAATAAAVTAATATASTVKSAPSASANEENDMDAGNESEKSAADSLSKDDPDYLQKVAAEEDKRRRNTAASARFRYKKKLREQALEQTAKEQTARAEALEARVKELEMEVKWLRGLIVEKDSRLHEVSASLDDQANKRIKLDVY
ncbi:hypothetical protein BGZ80_008439 [Entomortierella chlamydospora]|uniref:BZIP domain-containing protein n=1 Tax=Entomortierella chlamydospora TaxID=101097 RepID=A0A9P6MX95_9FUNG|nr:hypothetical protein BGZ79_000455 [Entomortierella chlamydospora]KAG0017294.1 hypothetical protein BGZ80_008439 [Entomortierella chlamydospora]